MFVPLTGLRDLGQVAEADCDEEELLTIQKNLDFLGRYIVQHRAALKAKREGRIQDAMIHRQNAICNYNLLDKEVQWNHE